MNKTALNGMILCNSSGSYEETNVDSAPKSVRKSKE